MNLKKIGLTLNKLLFFVIIVIFVVKIWKHQSAINGKPYANRIVNNGTQIYTDRRLLKSEITRLLNTTGLRRENVNFLNARIDSLVQAINNMGKGMEHFKEISSIR